MNAQEALDELKVARIYNVKSYQGNQRIVIEQDKEAVNVIQQLIDQSNAKPKTLEELGWEAVVIAADDVCYTKEIGEVELNIEVTPTYCSVNSFDEFLNQHGSLLSYEVILAIAEKMKELGMTGEQIDQLND